MILCRTKYNYILIYSSYLCSYKTTFCSSSPVKNLNYKFLLKAEEQTVEFYEFIYCISILEYNSPR